MSSSRFLFTAEAVTDLSIFAQLSRGGFSSESSPSPPRKYRRRTRLVPTGLSPTLQLLQGGRTQLPRFTKGSFLSERTSRGISRPSECLRLAWHVLLNSSLSNLEADQLPSLSPSQWVCRSSGMSLHCGDRFSCEFRAEFSSRNAEADFHSTTRFSQWISSFFSHDSTLKAPATAVEALDYTLDHTNWIRARCESSPFFSLRPRLRVDATDLPFSLLVFLLDPRPHGSLQLGPQQMGSDAQRSTVQRRSPRGSSA